jgi:hypothetical protein
MERATQPVIREVGMMTESHNDAGLPSYLTDPELVDPTVEDERAVAEAEADLAAGRFIRCHGDDAFRALLDDFASPEARAS